MNPYDVVVIGVGTAGQTAAYALKQKGLHVCLVDNSTAPGGTCALHGCQPKKWFYECTELVAKSNHLYSRGVSMATRGDWAAIFAEKENFTRSVVQGTVAGLEKAGIDYIKGTAGFLDERTIAVNGQRIESAYFLIATGAKPAPLPLKGAQHIITSNQFLQLDSLPSRIVFVGGGFISFEFAHFAQRLGPEDVRVTILEAALAPLGPFDEEMVVLLLEATAEEGIEVVSDVHIKAIGQEQNGYVIETRGATPRYADLVVHGAGRVPELDELNLEQTGVTFSRRGIEVTPHMQTTNTRIFAAGDCAATVQLARVADYEAMVAAGNIVSAIKGGTKAAVDYNTVPVVLFTYPQYAMVGHRESDLVESGTAYTKSAGDHLQWPTYRRIGMQHSAYKILAGSDGKLLGAHFISDNATGLVNSVRLAMISGMTVEELYRYSIMSPYPSRESDLTYMLKPLLG